MVSLQQYYQHHAPLHFLGTALAFAFTQGTGVIFLIFTFVGLGLAFPFILTIFFPGLIKFFPRPGNWMNTLKSFLGLSLLFTSIWLLSVLQTLTANDYIIWVLVSFSCFFFGIYLYQKICIQKITPFNIFLILGTLVLTTKYAPKSKSDNVIQSSELGLINKAGLNGKSGVKKSFKFIKKKNTNIY